jgi:parallel beta-helix repeat protein
MAQEGFKRKLTAILRSDVEGYSRLVYDARGLVMKTNRNSIRTPVNVFLGVYLSLFISLLSVLSYADNGPSEIWVSHAYNTATPGWNVTHFAVIQDGIAAVADGGTVHVKSGTYLENLIVKDKRITLSGEGAASTVVDGQNRDKCLQVLNASGSIISGFTFTNAFAGPGWMPFAVLLEGGDNITFRDNRVTGDSWGLGLQTFNNHIINNRIEGYGHIFICNSWGNLIEGNEVYALGGIWVSGQNNIIRNNIIIAPEPIACTGIRSWRASNNIYINNTLRNYRVHILLTVSNNCIVANNDISISGKNPPEGENASGAIIMYQSSSNTIINNKIHDVRPHGITLLASSNNNLIRANSITNTPKGIELYYQSNHNLVVNNNVSSTSIGIILDDASENKLYRNNFSNNADQGYDDGTNAWDHEGQGNYWSDYSGTDQNGDGIGDTPYQIGPAGNDRYPAILSFIRVPAEVPELDPVPYETGDADVVINDVTTWENQTKEINYTIFVKDGGRLIIRNSTLIVSFWSDVNFIQVLSGGSLEIYDSKITSHGSGIFADIGASLRIENSHLSGAGLWDGGGAIFVNGDGAIIKNNTIRQSFTGIALSGGSSYHQIIGNEITDAFKGIEMKGTTGIRFENNVITNIIAHGIADWGGAKNNIFFGNTFKDIWGRPIRLWHGGPNNPSVGNLLSENNFINFHEPAFDDGNNQWDYKGMGNYWSDYDGVDANGDGIGDSPYLTAGKGVDRCPLMAPAAHGKSTVDVEAFVTRFYQLCLGRNPDIYGLHDWIIALMNGYLAGSDVARGFIFSSEFLEKDTTNEELLDILYDAFFNRDPDPNGFSSWLSALKNGSTREEVLEGFIYSQEFKNMCWQYGILPDPLMAFVTRFYQQCLNRYPDKAGLEGWANDLLNKVRTGADVARGFIYSQEFIDKNSSNEEYLTILYHAFFNRDPDDRGWIDWMAELNYPKDRSFVLYGFLYSQEFFKLCEDYGINPY